MRTVILKGLGFSGLMLGILTFSSVFCSINAQVQSSGGVSIIIDGTSNIHDWDMKSDKGACLASYTIDDGGILTALNTLNFNLKAETLKSDHTAMDKNTYKAIGTGKYPNISFVSTSSSVKHNSGNSYTLTSTGRLTISSVTKNVTLVANCTLGSDQLLKGTGSYTLKMTDYNVTPPSIMFGAIKTGNVVTIKYDFSLRTK